MKRYLQTRTQDDSFSSGSNPCEHAQVLSKTYRPRQLRIVRRGVCVMCPLSTLPHSLSCFSWPCVTGPHCSARHQWPTVSPGSGRGLRGGVPPSLPRAPLSRGSQAAGRGGPRRRGATNTFSSLSRMCPPSHALPHMCRVRWFERCVSRPQRPPLGRLN